MFLLALTLLTQQRELQLFPPIDHPGTDPHFAADVVTLCPSNVAHDRAALFKREEDDSRHAVPSHDASAWRALSCDRALLSGMGALSHEGPMMIAGDSWAEGGVKALLQLLALEPTDKVGTELLATLLLQDEEPRDLHDGVALLDRAVTLGVVGSATLRGCADLALRARQPEITERCAQRALAVGRDSTWHSLLLARLAFRKADSVGGLERFVTAAGAAHDTIAKLDVAWHLQWFVSPQERTAWAKLADAERGPWMRDHLVTRDIRDGQPAGARLAEHFKRLEFVESEFRLKVPAMLHTGMLSRPSSGLQPPAPAQTTNGNAIPMTSQGGRPSPISNLLDNAFRDYVRWQVEWDDRGVIWMRYGEPRLRGVFRGPEEIWRYDIDGRELLMTFVGEDYDGSAGATRLLSGRISENYCGIDIWRCQLAMQYSFSPIPPEIRAAVKQQDLEYIGVGTTHDDNSIRTDDPIEVTARMHRLWDPVSGAPIALLTYAVKKNDIVVLHDSSASTARIEFDFRRWDNTLNRREDTSFARRFDFADKNSQRLTGFLITPSAPSVSAWSLVATQSDKRRGRAWDVGTSPLDTGMVVLSDLVIGQEGQGVVWNNHNEKILLAPLNALTRKTVASLYYQIRSDADHERLRSVIGIFREDAGVISTTAALEFSVSMPLRAGINELAPILDLSNLSAGTYWLEVKVTDAKGDLVTRRTVRLNLD